MTQETWTLLGRTQNTCMVQRVQDGRLTVWSMADRGSGWRIYAVRFSRAHLGCNHKLQRTKLFAGDCTPAECWDTQQHKNGQRLTDARFHRMLKSFCDTGHGL